MRRNGFMEHGEVDKQTVRHCTEISATTDMVVRFGQSYISSPAYTVGWIDFHFFYEIVSVLVAKVVCPCELKFPKIYLIWVDIFMKRITSKLRLCSTQSVAVAVSTFIVSPEYTFCSDIIICLDIMKDNSQSKMLFQYSAMSSKSSP